MGPLPGVFCRLEALIRLDQGQVLVGRARGAIQGLDATTGSLLYSLEGHWHVVSSLVLDGSDRLVSGSHDRSVRIWDLNAKTPISELSEEGRVNAVAVHRGQVIAAVEGGRELHIWGQKRGRWTVIKAIEAFSGEGVTNPTVPICIGKLQLVLGCGVSKVSPELKVFNLRNWKLEESLETQGQITAMVISGLCLGLGIAGQGLAFLHPTAY